MAGSPLQIVPSSTCLQCDVCCRFPERESFLRPYFTAEEIAAAIAVGVAPGHFPSHAGSQIRVVSNPQGDGYLCPAFDPVTAQCRIYDVRPLDCRLYPFALMWDKDYSRVLLGWDTKCPFLQEQPSSVIDRAANDIALWLEAEEHAARIARNPKLIGRFQEDVVPIRPLTGLTDAIVRAQADLPRQALRLQDRDRVEAALLAAAGLEALPLAAYSFAYHYVWRHRLAYSWRELHGHLCLFAESPDGLFMGALPLGPGPLALPLEAAFREMRRHNGDSSVTRVENVPEARVPALRALGYRLTCKDPDYVYAAADVADLAGDAYRAQRAACNRFSREQGSVLEPYGSPDKAECLRLFDEWVAQKRAAGADDWSQALLEDAGGAHETALTYHDALGLTGAVVRVQGRIRAYTLGLWLNPTVFCVMLEVADRQVAGVGAFIFREFCRQARSKGASWINTMDDSSLPGLVRSKQWYRPAQLLPNYIVTES